MQNVQIKQSIIKHNLVGTNNFYQVSLAELGNTDNFNQLLL